MGEGGSLFLGSPLLLCCFALPGGLAQGRPAATSFYLPFLLLICSPAQSRLLKGCWGGAALSGRARWTADASHRNRPHTKCEMTMGSTAVRPAHKERALRIRGEARDGCQAYI